MVSVLYSELDSTLAGLEQFEDCVLPSFRCVVAVDGQDLIPNLDPAVQKGSLILDHLLDIDPQLVRGFLLNEEAQPPTGGF